MNLLMSKMKNKKTKEIRIFGAKGCKKCLTMIEGMCGYGMSFLFVDAMADDTQDLCDEHHVNHLPHVQILDGDGKVIFEHIGYVNPLIIKKKSGQ